MTMWGFLAEVWKRTEGDPGVRKQMMPFWEGAKCLFAIIDAAKDPEGIELRRQWRK
jgi:hypothetical protein